MSDITDREIEEYIEMRLRQEGCTVVDFDVPAARGRLLALGCPLIDVFAGKVPNVEFWRAVYGPAYPALVTA